MFEVVMEQLLPMHLFTSSAVVSLDVLVKGAVFCH